MRLARLLILSPLLCLSLLADPADLALQNGERLSYRVAWGLFPRAGEITIAARTEVDDGNPHTVVTTHTSTRGLLRRLFRFEAKAEAIFDQRTGRMAAYLEHSESKKKTTHTTLELDYASSTARFTDFIDSAKSATVPLTGESPTDLIMSLVKTRTWNLKPGEKRDTNVIFGKDIYLLTVHALRYEKVRTPLGIFDTVVLEPRMEKTPPKGMFKRGSQVHVWIAIDDERHLPVQFEVEFSFGAGIATLTEYDPPASGETPVVAAE